MESNHFFNHLIGYHLCCIGMLKDDEMPICFESRSTTTGITSYPFDFGDPVMKFINMSSQTWTRIGRVAITPQVWSFCMHLTHHILGHKFYNCFLIPSR
ncbi:hypothetical protein F511_03458 [Dorcoceras hygrometricum]|uniref:Uncharacterized protein n=1 Tax=Dorcoceras hygrometricum TaxID=472368 RepID=A0A2Z7DDC9_9LAMI|nr:hypothetical protein F511_03458 [Dorcoceras hygrometricum]